MTAIETAASILSSATRGYCRAYHLTGPSNAATRQAIMSALLGRKVPKAQAGINALEKELAKQLGVTGTCLADLDDNIATTCRAIVAGLTLATA